MAEFGTLRLTCEDTNVAHGPGGVGYLTLLIPNVADITDAEARDLAERIRHADFTLRRIPTAVEDIAVTELVLVNEKLIPLSE